MREPLSAEVQAMLDGGPTAPLKSFVAAYEQDDNLWWMIDGGHHQNLFEAAVAAYDEQRAEVDAMSRLAAFEQGKNTRLRTEVKRLRAQVADLASLLNQAAGEVGDMYWEPDPNLRAEKDR